MRSAERGVVPPPKLFCLKTIGPKKSRPSSAGGEQQGTAAGIREGSTPACTRSRATPSCSSPRRSRFAFSGTRPRWPCLLGAFLGEFGQLLDEVHKIPGISTLASLQKSTISDGRVSLSKRLETIGFRKRCSGSVGIFEFPSSSKLASVPLRAQRDAGFALSYRFPKFPGAELRREAALAA